MGDRMSEALSINLGAIRLRSTLTSESGKLSGDKSLNSYAESNRNVLQEKSEGTSNNPEIRKLKAELLDLRKELKAAMQEGGGEASQKKIQLIQAKIEQIEARIREIEKQEEAKKAQHTSNSADPASEQDKVDALDIGALVNVKV